MAQIVLGIGTSHSPLLTLDSREWRHRSRADFANKNLTLADGSSVDYQELVRRRGEPFAEDATEENFAQIATRCQAHLDRLAEAIAAANLDVMVVIGDDQDEFYTPGNMPAIALYWGQDVSTHKFDDGIPDWMNEVARGYAMDEVHHFPGHPVLAREIIDGLMEREVDLAIANEVPNPDKAGFGHAFGFPAERLFGDREIPMIPIMLNTYFPPNVMTASRAHDVGKKLAAAIEASPSDLRVGILASGGLSHFVVEEDLDRLVVEGLADPAGTALRSIPREALLEGSSEILNWVMTAGASMHLALEWSSYEPIRRTPAGTGIGCGFAIWRGDQ
jgi:hypothetical protein